MASNWRCRSILETRQICHVGHLSAQGQDRTSRIRSKVPYINHISLTILESWSLNMGDISRMMIHGPSILSSRLSADLRGGKNSSSRTYLCAPCIRALIFMNITTFYSCTDLRALLPWSLSRYFHKHERYQAAV